MGQAWSLWSKSVGPVVPSALKARHSLLLLPACQLHTISPHWQPLSAYNTSQCSQSPGCQNKSTAGGGGAVAGYRLVVAFPSGNVRLGSKLVKRVWGRWWTAGYASLAGSWDKGEEWESDGWGWRGTTGCLRECIIHDSGAFKSPMEMLLLHTWYLVWLRFGNNVPA